jgi:hypothetical protein
MHVSNVDGATALLLMTYTSVFIEAEAMTIEGVGLSGAVFWPLALIPRAADPLLFGAYKLWSQRRGPSFRLQCYTERFLPLRSKSSAHLEQPNDNSSFRLTFQW